MNIYRCFKIITDYDFDIIVLYKHPHIYTIRLLLMITI